MSNQIIFGSSILTNPVPQIDGPIFSYPGKSFGDANSFQLNEDLLSRHVLLLGGSGCGKSNAFFFTIDNLRQNATSDDVFIIFDTKGEFYEKFHREGDYVIGNSAEFRRISHTWNIFEEILADGDDEYNVMLNAREIAASLFHGRGSETQPFFCNAARDVFYGVLMHLIRLAKARPELRGETLNNKALVESFHTFKVEDYLAIFRTYPDLTSFISYFGDGTSGQALGVFGELNSMISDYFVGILAEHNPQKSLSVRNAVKNKGGKAIFVEYDLSIGETLSPVYRLLVDQALKEALTRKEKEIEEKGNGNVYFFADEFKLLPKLQHIDDALNFGRGLGVKVMAGIQSIDQLYDIYGKEKGAVLASGFGSMFAFHTNDDASRNYIAKRFGPNIIIYDYNDTYRNVVTSKERDGNTAEIWDQMNLGLGQAIIGLGREKPFVFQFDKY